MNALKAILPLVMFGVLLALALAAFRSLVVVFRGVRRECSTWI